MAVTIPEPAPERFRTDEAVMVPRVPAEPVGQGPGAGVLVKARGKGANLEIEGGLFLGRWLDSLLGLRIFLSAPLLLLGVCAGFWSAWRWMRRQ